MLTKSQKDLLRSVGRKPNSPDLGTPNPELDKVIEQIKRSNPQAFLKDYELYNRVFMNEPINGIVYKSYIYQYKGKYESLA